MENTATKLRPQIRNSPNLIWLKGNGTTTKKKSSSSTDEMISLCGIILSLVFLNLLIILRDFYSSFNFMISIFKYFLRFFSGSWSTTARAAPSATATAKPPIEKCCSTGDETAEADDHNLNLCLLELRKMIEGISLGRSSSCHETHDHEVNIILSADEIGGVFEEEEPSLKEVKAAFDVFDENKDGFIDAEELRNVLVSLGFIKEAASEEECKRMIKGFDENLDGRIDFNEFVKVMERSFC